MTHPDRKNAKHALISRRAFVSATSAAVLAREFLARDLSAMPRAYSASGPTPTTSQLAWQRDERALFLHYGTTTFTDKEWGDGYEKPEIFNPTRLDARQWAKTAKATGFPAMILTAKHHDGFCLWPTRTTKHSVASSPFRDGKGDVVREFVDACRAEGLKPGLYCSPWDRNSPLFGEGKKYDDLYIEQLTELLTGYGDIYQLWFDAANGETQSGDKQVYDWARIFATVRRLQPNAIIFSDAGPDARWIGNDRGDPSMANWSRVDPKAIPVPGFEGPMVNAMLQSGHADGTVWRPGETDISIRPTWYHHASEDRRVKPAGTLVAYFFQSVGRNSKLLLNVPPNREGLFSDVDVAALSAMHKTLSALFADDLTKGLTQTWTSAAPNKGVLEIDLRRTVGINIIDLREDISRGQSVAQYITEGFVNDTWHELSKGTTIGYRALDRIQQTGISKFRVRIEESVDTLNPIAVHLYAEPSPDAGYEAAGLMPATATRQSGRYRQLEMIMRNTSRLRLLIAAALSSTVMLVDGASISAQARAPRFARADTLRGTNTPERRWWDATFYDLHVRVNPKDSTISGSNGISYRVLQPSSVMQIDLQQPMMVDSLVQNKTRVEFRRDTNTIFATLTTPQKTGAVNNVTVYYHGRPAAAKNPPWDGGYIWRKDKSGNPFISTANEGIGASLWWPLKDITADEVDSQRVAVSVPDPMVNVSNGRLRSTKKEADGYTTYEYFASEPINAYGISVNAGTYAHYTETYKGEAGDLTMDFWPLAENLEAAKVQFAQAKPMMACFEKWFGPYPWYKDGYKLVEAPYLGMEHQSAVTYGNGYKNGYRGSDLSATGHGLKWDFIIIHESAHEWFANSLTDEDPADMWIHESFANYSEGLYTECQEGKQAGAEYVIGTRKKVVNDEPIIGSYGVNKTGSGDVYYKGGNMLHTMRQIINDDEKWRGVLRGLQAKFRHQTVSGAEVQAYMTQQSGVDLTPVFNQYLYTTRIPIFEYRRDAKGALQYRWNNVVAGFNMPIKVSIDGAAQIPLKPTGLWQTMTGQFKPETTITVDENYYVLTRKY